MKKLILVGLASTCLPVLLGLHNPVQANEIKAAWLSAGASPGGSFSGALGARKGMLGIEIGAVATSVPSGTLDYPVPHANFTSQGRYSGSAYGADVLAFANLDRTGNFSVYAGPGLYAQNSIEVARSNVTGWYYANSTSTNVVVAGSAGLRVKISPTVEIGASYHTIRGIQGSVGIRF